MPTPLAFPFLISVEETPGSAVRGGFHLGTDERVARAICEMRYGARRRLGLPVVTVALLDANGRIVDVFLGAHRWQSELEPEYTEPAKHGL